MPLGMRKYKTWNVYKNPEFESRDYMKDYLYSKHRVLIKGEADLPKFHYLLGHRRSGKDRACMQSDSAAMHAKPNITCLQIARTQVQGRKSFFNARDQKAKIRLINGAFPPESRLPGDRGVNEQQMMIKLRNGSIWQVLGGDEPEALRGMAATSVTVSEWQLQNKPGDLWDVLTPMVLESKGVITLNGHYWGSNHARQLERRVRSHPLWKVYYWKADETGVFTPEELEKERQSSILAHGEVEGNARFEREYMLSHKAIIPGTVYGDFIRRAENNGQMKVFGYNPEFPVYTVWDIGVGDTTAILFFQVYDGKIWYIDFYENMGESYKHYVNWIKEQPYDYETHFLPHDGSHRDFSSETAEPRQVLIERAGLKNVEVLSIKSSSDLTGIDLVRVNMPKMMFNIGNSDDSDVVREDFGDFLSSDSTGEDDMVLSFNGGTTGKTPEQRMQQFMEGAELYHYKILPDGVTRNPMHDWTSNRCAAWRYSVSAVKLIEERNRFPIIPPKNYDPFFGMDPTVLRHA